MDLTEDIKKWQENTELYKKYNNNNTSLPR